MIDITKIDITKAQVLAELQTHNGRAQGIHMRDLVGRITNSVLTGEAHERKVRELIQELRLEHYPICAHPASGYYMATDAHELDEACTFLLDRAHASVEQVAAMKGRQAPDLYAALGVHKANR